MRYFIKGTVFLALMLLFVSPSLARQSHSPLINAAIANDVNRVSRILSVSASGSLKEYVDVRDRKNWTPLHHAVWHHSIESAEVLIEKGADVDAKTSGSWTPLHWAAWIGDIKAVRILLEANANVHVRDGSGLTPLHRAALRMGDPGFGKTPENYTEIARLLIDKGADIHARTDQGETPFHLATKKLEFSSTSFSYNEKVETAQHAGLDPDYKSNHNITFIARRIGRLERNTEALIEEGITVVDTITNDDTTVIIIIKSADTKSVERILKGLLDNER